MVGYSRPEEFDAFLSSVLWEDDNGVPLSVVSLLARQDFDPWETSTRFANMPLQAGTQALADLIAPQAVLAGLCIDAKLAAERAVQLLPQNSLMSSLSETTRPSLRGFLERICASPGTRKRDERS